MKKSIFLLLILFVCYQRVAAQEASMSDKLDKFIKAGYGAISPGCVVLIAQNGKIVYEKAYGSADLELGIPMKNEMIFNIASITKTFTAAAILQLVEAGKIRLEDSIQRYVPDFPYKGSVITIENLLTHTSGIKNYLEIKKTGNRSSDSYTPEEGVASFKEEPLLFKPGTRFEYSNSNYYLLGYIIEKVTGMTYQQFLKEKILASAGLVHTAYINQEKNIVGRAAGYVFSDSSFVKAVEPDVTSLYAAGGLMSDAEDLFRWQQALSSGKIISSDMLKRATTPFQLKDHKTSEYGYGWYLKSIDGVGTMEHSGSMEGFQSDLIYLPGTNTLVVTLFNCFGPNANWMVFSNDIARIVLNKPVDEGKKMSAESLKSYTGVYRYSDDHKLIVTMKEGQLYVESSNPRDRLPRVKLFSKSPGSFYIKESELTFEFGFDDQQQPLKITTYNRNGKDADWLKVK